MFKLHPTTELYDGPAQGFLNCAAPLRLGVMALAICFDSSPKKFYVFYLHRIFRILGLCSKNNSIFHRKLVAVTLLNF